ncbi:hypothetical protein DFH11DRAFT_1542981 [Phellopilus nigrolimitatus]|nr:hypothetical protein DFH11DRAFT_1542981 [Phellopilus nigrolimitatus]
MQPLISYSADSVLSPGFRDAAYLRIASLAIGGYEYLSIAVIVISNVGFFGQFSSLEACRRFMLVSPIFKGFAHFQSSPADGCVSDDPFHEDTHSFAEITMGVLDDAESFSGGYTSTPFSVITLKNINGPQSKLEFFADIYKRTPVHNPITSSCTSGNASLHRIAWVNYAVAMVFDLIAICISTGYLWFYSSTATSLLYEGLGYFVILTAVNVFNLVLYLKESESTQVLSFVPFSVFLHSRLLLSPKKSTGASLGYVIIFIMSQRILIKQKALHLIAILKPEYAEKYAESERSYEVTLALDTTREINNALRSQFETTVKSSPFIDTFAVTSLRSQSTHPGSQEVSQSELDVQVRIEQTVVVERNAAAMRRESYRTPRVLWGSRA